MRPLTVLVSLALIGVSLYLAFEIYQRANTKAETSVGPLTKVNATLLKAVAFLCLWVGVFLLAYEHMDTWGWVIQSVISLIALTLPDKKKESDK